jgi:hypothetical protein
MLARLCLAVVASIALVAPQAIEASPITYDFAGTLNHPWDGSSQFSGSFAIDSIPNVPVATPGGSGSAVGEDGAVVSLTVHIGGQTLTYLNTAQNPTNVFFSAGDRGTIEVPPPPLSVGFELAAQSDDGHQAGFRLDFSRPGGNFDVSELANLASPSYSSSVTVTIAPRGQAQEIQGSLTSIELVSTPEPGTLAVFGLMALAGLAHRRFRK